MSVGGMVCLPCGFGYRCLCVVTATSVTRQMPVWEIGEKTANQNARFIYFIIGYHSSVLFPREVDDSIKLAIVFVIGLYNKFCLQRIWI